MGKAWLGVLGVLLAAPVLAGDVPGQFDYYVLALSWSPDHCAARPSDTEQCTRQLGFVLHGLWPQYRSGYPADCRGEPLAGDIPRRFAGLYPSRFLFRHEWEKHGTCSGLAQEPFHRLAAGLKARVRIPPQYVAPAQPLRQRTAELKSAFLAANTWLVPDSVAVACSGGGRFLKEVYVCTDRQGGAGVACGADVLAGERRSCRQPDLLVRSVR